MANLLLTADLHLGHSNVIRYDNRPFDNVDQMNKELIRRFNERVKEDDTCIIVGDFCFKNSPNGKEGEGLPVHAKNYIKQLNGIKVFVRGNHDKNNSVQTKIERLVLKVGGIYINVCHRPDDAIILDDRYYSLNIVGHVHNAWTTKEIEKNGKFSLMINVGVTTNKYYPYTFDEVKAIYDKWVHNHKMRKEINKCLLTQSQKNK
jgi:calcineurin-like phosphoesterase family protein